MKQKKLTVSFHIGNEEVKSLEPSQRELIGERLTQVMSDYYTTHLDEYKKIRRNKEK